MTDKCSPEPWQITFGFFSPQIRDANGDLVAEDIYGVGDTVDSEYECKLANARLMVAAPWLRKACELQDEADRLRDVWLCNQDVPGHDNAGDHRAWHKALGLAEEARRMGISKTKGGQP